MRSHASVAKPVHFEQIKIISCVAISISLKLSMWYEASGSRSLQFIPGFNYSWFSAEIDYTWKRLQICLCAQVRITDQFVRTRNDEPPSSSAPDRKFPLTFFLLLHNWFVCSPSLLLKWVFICFSVVFLHTMICQKLVLLPDQC